MAPLILKSAHVTEKATDLTRENQYVFKVFPRATEQEIKKAVEEVYGVDVLKVRTIKVRRKQRRLGRTLGWRKGYKKAIVTLKEDQKIEILPR
ncbi:50S ribosomal protein L23 [Patescibacteria group bacterium]|nr:50S ribosomal protein L23 [Patescibacteria group bacterium]